MKSHTVLHNQYSLSNYPFQSQSSLVPFVSTIYYIWIVDEVTTDCKLNFQQSAIPNNVKIYLDSDFLV